MKKFAHVVGTRPNFIKMMPVYYEMEKAGWVNDIIHTGQHYDHLMSDIFFEELTIPEPDYYLNSTTVPQMIEGIGNVLADNNHDGVVLYGDVHSTLAGAIAAMNLDIPIIHIESGLRSHDKTMPEERNRVVVDHVSTYRFCTERKALHNLINEDLHEGNYLVGNTAIDTLRLLEPNRLEVPAYALMTLHRPFNVDDPARLAEILRRVNALEIPTTFPVHPRTKPNIDMESYPNIEFIDPLGYKDFIRLMKNSHYVISDSGGNQCDAAAMGVPIFTLRPSTEHIMTLNLGFNRLIEIDDIDNTTIENWLDHIPTWIEPYEWDGFAALRVVDKLRELS